MLTVTQIIDGVLAREGWPQLTNRAADKGGWTKGGITTTSWGQYAHLGRPATPAELNAITESQARGFYFDRHVMPYQDVPDVPDPLRTLLADWSVTSWHDDPTKAVQVQLAKLGLYKGAIDGGFGPLTKAALQTFFGVPSNDARAFYLEIVKARIRQLVNEALDDGAVQQFLQDHKNTDLSNLRGWVNRGLEFVA